MLIAKRKNRVLRIPDEKAEEYIKLGYSIKTPEGDLVHEHLTVEQKLARAEKENAALKEQVENLKKEKESLEKAVEVLGAELEGMKEKNVVPEEGNPKESPSDAPKDGQAETPAKAPKSKK